MTDLCTAPAPVRFASYDRARDAWPLDPSLVHLNHGSFGAVPSEVVAFEDTLRREADRSPIGWYPRLAERIAAARVATAPFVGARAEDSVFVPNASAAATVIFNSLGLGSGDEILVTDHGYGAVTMGAERLGRRTGAIVRTVRIGLFDDSETILGLFADAITRRTRLIVVDQITSPTARVLPTREITGLANAQGVRVLVDGAHAPGLIPDASVAGGGDWWFGNLHKWPCAPRGATLLVTTAPDREELWPLIDSWGAPDPYPARFDTQGTIDATTYLATPAAIDFIEREYGWERARVTMSQIADAGARIVADAFDRHSDEPTLVDQPMSAPSMRLIRLPAGIGRSREEADDLRMRIYDEVGVETAFTSFEGIGYFRLSAHLYTELSDFEAFADRCVPLILRTARRSSDGSST